MENSKLKFEIENILVKYSCCLLRFFFSKMWEKFRGHAGLAFHKSASGLGPSGSESPPCLVSPRDGHQIMGTPLSVIVVVVVVSQYVGNEGKNRGIDSLISGSVACSIGFLPVKINATFSGTFLKNKRNFLSF